MSPRAVDFPTVHAVPARTYFLTNVGGELQLVRGLGTTVCTQSYREHSITARNDTTYAPWLTHAFISANLRKTNPGRTGEWGRESPVVNRRSVYEALR